MAKRVATTVRRMAQGVPTSAVIAFMTIVVSASLAGCAASAKLSVTTPLASQRSFDSVLLLVNVEPDFNKDMELAFVDELRGRSVKVQVAHQIFEEWPSDAELKAAAIDKGLGGIVYIDGRGRSERKIARVGDAVGPGGVYKQNAAYGAVLWDAKAAFQTAWAGYITGGSGMLSGFTKTQEYRAVCMKAARRAAQELIKAGAIR